MRPPTGTGETPLRVLALTFHSRKQNLRTENASSYPYLSLPLSRKKGGIRFEPAQDVGNHYCDHARRRSFIPGNNGTLHHHIHLSHGGASRTRNQHQEPHRRSWGRLALWSDGVGVRIRRHPVVDQRILSDWPSDRQPGCPLHRISLGEPFQTAST